MPELPRLGGLFSSQAGLAIVTEPIFQMHEGVPRALPIRRRSSCGCAILIASRSSGSIGTRRLYGDRSLKRCSFLTHARSVCLHLKPAGALKGPMNWVRFEIFAAHIDWSTLQAYILKCFSNGMLPKVNETCWNVGLASTTRRRSS